MSNQNQPDWDSIAEKFDLWLPQLAPVGENLLTALAAKAGDKVLDVASGTGEPALTLARRYPDIEITGIDAAAAMAKVAQKKVVAEQLGNITFTSMPAENMAFDDASFDKVLCRFGVMLFTDPLQGSKEIYRILKPGGRFALAVWSTPETMTTMHWASLVFKGRIPEDDAPPISKVTSLGQPGVLEALLKQAGFQQFEIEKKRFDYQFASFEDYWEIIEASDIMKQQFDALPNEQRNEVRDEVARFARDFQSENGLTIPHEYLLAYGTK